MLGQKIFTLETIRPSPYRRHGSIFQWSITLLLATIGMALSPLVATAVVQQSGIYFLLLLAIILYAKIRLKRNLLHPLFLSGQFGLLICIFLKGLPGVSEHETGTTDKIIPALLASQLLIAFFGVRKNWSNRRLWSFSTLPAFSGLFMDAMFWYPPSAFALTLITLPGLNAKLLGNRLMRLPLTFRWSAALFLSTYALSTLLSPAIYQSLQRGFLFLLPALVILGNRSRWSIESILFGLTVSMASYCLLFLSNPASFQQTILFEINTNRAAGYLAPFILLFTALLVSGKLQHRAKKTASVAVIATALPILFLMESEGGLLALLAGGVLWISMRFLFSAGRSPARIQKALRSLLVAMSALPLLIWLIYAPGASPILDYLAERSHHRIPLWHSFHVEFQSRGLLQTLFGRGPLQFDSLPAHFPVDVEASHAAIEIARSTGGSYLHSHSLALEWIVGSGVIGFLAFLCLVATAPGPGFRNWEIAVPVLTAVIVHGLVDFLIDIPAISMAFWIGLLGLWPATGRNPAGRGAPGKPALLKPASAGLVLILGLGLHLQLLSDRTTLQMSRQIPFGELDGNRGLKLRRCNDLLWLEGQGQSDFDSRPWKGSRYGFYETLPIWSMYVLDPATVRRNASIFLVGYQLTGNGLFLARASEHLRVCIQSNHFHAICEFGLLQVAALENHRSLPNLDSIPDSSDPLGVLSECMD